MAHCPYCNAEIEDAIHNYWIGDYWTNADFECPKCDKEMVIDVEMEPVFYVSKKEGVDEEIEEEDL